MTAVEKDPALADRLAEALGSPPSLTVLKGDALDFIKAGACDGFPALVSNLPYQAGTRILRIYCCVSRCKFCTDIWQQDHQGKI